MIEGNFRDVSLPGLLQFLSAEVGKCYRIRVSSAKHSGEVFVSKGTITAATFGLLEGEDALCEFFGWQDGTFGVELLNQQIEIKPNLHLPVVPSEALADQTSFLNEKKVGLNSLIVASKDFGTPEWQENLVRQPLHREDFLVLTWLKDGRTMRQAMREFNWDIVFAAGALFRLTATKSILIRRPGSKDGLEPGAEPVRIVNPASIERFLTTGGQEAAAAIVAREVARDFKFEENTFTQQEFFVSTAFQDPAEQSHRPPQVNRPAEITNMRPSMESRLRARSLRIIKGNSLVNKSVSHDDEEEHEVAKAPNASAVTLPPVPLRELLVSQAGNKEDADAALAAIAELNEDNPRRVDDPVRSAPRNTPEQIQQSILATESVIQQMHAASSSKQSGSDIVSPSSQFASGAASNVNAFADLVDEAPVLSAEERATTGSLPLVAFDIERLLRNPFKQTQFGKLALTNPSLDSMRRQTLIDVGKAKTLTDVLMEETRTPAAVLASFRYCLDRGYIESNDPVVPLTADLLLGRVEVDQYLLQRRRITGDELRDLLSNARSHGISLIDLLFKEHYLTVTDVETLIREQKRFAPR